jgi:hypothetical protein
MIRRERIVFALLVSPGVAAGAVLYGVLVGAVGYGLARLVFG